MKIRILLISAAMVVVAGCATPHVVEVEKIGDSSLTCQQISDQIDEANKFEKAARDERKVTGKNVAAAVLFWPALLGTYANTEDAINAAKERKIHLRELYKKKGCS